MISVDSTGLILEWIYTEEYFSGFGWFNPARRFMFDLRTAPGATQASYSGSVRLVTAYVVPAAGEVHLLTERGGTAYLTIADLTSGRLWPAVVHLSGNPSEAKLGKDSRVYNPACVCYVPGLDTSRSDYCYITVRSMPLIFFYFLLHISISDGVSYGFPSLAAVVFCGLLDHHLVAPLSPHRPDDPSTFSLSRWEYESAACLCRRSFATQS